MKRGATIGWRALIGLTLALAGAGAKAQPQAGGRAPEIGYACPAGGQRGTTFTVAVGGQRLEETKAVLFSCGGIQARVVSVHRFLSAKELNLVQEELRKLQEKRQGGGLSEADEKRLAELRKKAENRPNRQVPPALAETAMLEVTIAPDAPRGSCELRLATPGGLSNPLVFQTGDLPEMTEPLAQRGRQPAPGSDKVDTIDVALPATLNGRILPAEKDRWRFEAKRGQRLVFVVGARALIPYLADAVPGWFQATLALRGPDGKEVAYVDDFRFEPDPVLAYDIPADGRYTIEIRDAIDRDGRISCIGSRRASCRM